MRKSYRPRQKNDNIILINNKTRMNRFRVINGDGAQLGILNKDDALKMARQKGLDLILISTTANPPVAKILDVSKHKYDLKRKQKKQKSARVDTKEVQFRPSIAENDLNTKVSKINKFLGEGKKVKVLVKFRGRENRHKDLGMTLLKDVISKVDNGSVEKEPMINNNLLIMGFKPAG